MTSIQPEKSQITLEFEKVFSSDHITDHYPILNSGIETGIVHWLFQSYYVLLGNELDYQPITEYPFFDEDYRMIIGEATNRNTQNQSDVSWLNRDGKIKCAVEFEKYQSHPRKKARNLIRYSEQQDDLDLIILHYWDTDSQRSTPLTKQIKDDLRDGFDYHQPEADTILIETVFLNESINGHSFTQIIDTYPQSV